MLHSDVFALGGSSWLVLFWVDFPVSLALPGIAWPFRLILAPPAAAALLLSFFIYISDRSMDHSLKFYWQITREWENWKTYLQKNLILISQTQVYFIFQKYQAWRPSKQFVEGRSQFDIYETNEVNMRASKVVPWERKTLLGMFWWAEQSACCKEERGNGTFHIRRFGLCVVKMASSLERSALSSDSAHRKWWVWNICLSARRGHLKRVRELGGTESWRKGDICMLHATWCFTC